MLASSLRCDVARATLGFVAESFWDSGRGPWKTARSPISFGNAVHDCCAPRFDEKPIRGFVLGAFGQFGFGEGVFEVVMEFLAPGVYFGPRHFTAFDCEQSFAMGLSAHGYVIMRDLFTR